MVVVFTRVSWQTWPDLSFFFCVVCVCLGLEQGRPPISDHTVSEALERVATFAKKHILNPPEQIRLE